MSGEPYRTVGRIVKTHGLRGEVSVKFEPGASLDVLIGLEAWLVPPPHGLRATRIDSVRPGPKGPIVKLEGVDDPETAAKIGGCELLVSAGDLPEGWGAQEDASDVLGMKVLDVERGPLGEVDDVIVTGSNDVWVVNGPFGEVLIPVIDDVIVGYDDDSDTTTVRLLPGLIQDEQ